MKPLDTERAKLTILILVVAIIVFAITFQLNSSPSIRVQADLFSRWYATKQLLETGRNLYDQKNMNETVNYKAIPTNPLETGFFYPAHLLIFLVPLAILPYPGAHFIWTLIGQLFLIIGLWFIMREVQWPETTSQKTLALFLAMLFIPYIQHTVWSQFDTIAVFGLAMVIRMLKKERYLSAGLWASLFTFKPQDGMIALIFFMIWSLFISRRRQFVIGFVVAALGLWAIAQALQPGWISEFLKSLSVYRKLPYELSTIPDMLGVAGVVLGIFLICMSSYLLLHYRKEPVDTPGVYFALVANIGVFWIVFPLIGMMHLTLLPFGVVLLLAGLRKQNYKIYQAALALFIILYFGGYAGFIFGLITPGITGDHIRLAELVYKWITPAVIVIVSIIAGARPLLSKRVA